MTNTNNQTLVSFLKEHFKEREEVKFSDRLKIVYRPYICPFLSLLEEIDHNDVVFDVGCGSGQFALLTAKFAAPKMIYGIEIFDELISNAKALTDSLETETQFGFNKYDGINVPETIGISDKIFMIDVLHHIPKSSQIPFLESLYSKMKIGSKLILKDINAGSILVYANKLHDALFAGELGNEISQHRACQVLEKLGFKIEKVEKKLMFVYPHYTITATK